jgi:hypothetical protein
MNCHDTVEALALYVAGEADERTASAVEAHLETCGTCTGVLRQTRAATDLARRAMRAAEPGEGFADAVMSAIGSVRPGGEPVPAAAKARKGDTSRARRGTPPRRYRAIALATTLAAAAAALLVVLLRPVQSGRLVEGDIGEAGGRIVAGREYAAVRQSILKLSGGSKALVSKGTRFALDARELDLLEGSCVVAAVGARADQTCAVRVRAGFVVRFAKADVYVHAGRAPAARASWIALCLPVAHAAEEDEPLQVVVALAGAAEVELPDRKVALEQDQALFMSGPAGIEELEGPVDRFEFLKDAEGRLERLAREARTLTRRTRTYRRVVASYGRDLVAKRARLAALGPADPERTELVFRISLVEEMREVHGRRLGELAREASDGDHEQMKRRVMRIRAAGEAYGRMLKHLGPAEPGRGKDAGGIPAEEGEVSL